MNRRFSPITIVGLALFLIFGAVEPALADGIVIIEPPDPRDPPSYLSIQYHRVDVTIEDQVATTHVDQVFVNESRHQLEGVYVFPLPEGATITDFSMWVDGEKLAGEILPADEARRIYEDIVRRQRDPALLEYIGRNTFRARIFPIPPKSKKRVEIEYTEILPLDNGLIHYRYPLDTERFSAKPIEDVSIRVQIRSQEAIKAVYSPSHDIAVDRRGDYRVTVGYEDVEVLPDTDFDLYYTVAQEDIGLNLLSFAEEGEDGFFLMLLAPQVEVEESEIVAKDVILVLDTSGSMRGEKLAQAKKALSLVLDQLHERDRFNVVAFSTGVRQFKRNMSDIEQQRRALRWVDELEAKGGTDINRAMLEALAQIEDGRSSAERPAIVIFLTDGLATEGVTETDKILRNVEEAAPDNARIFTFGVGDDVNTILLDKMARDHRGASAYVRPGQSIDEEVSAFYAKVSTPLLSDLNIDFGRVHVEDTYPYPLPDLFAGTQIVMVGRYRLEDEGERALYTTVTLRGTVNGQQQTFEYGDVRLHLDGGDPFIPRLWATRKVGYLLNQIRLHGESKEVVEEIVDLAVRYGIMTPYTSFLVNEDNQVFSQEGRDRTAQREHSIMATATPAAPSGKAAVDEAEKKTELERSETATGATGSVVKIVQDKVFLWREEMWIDTTFDADHMIPVKVGFMSEGYFALVAARPEWGTYLSIGERVLVVLEGTDGEPLAYQVVGQGEGEKFEIPPTKEALPTQAAPTLQATTDAQATPVAQATAVPRATATPRQSASTSPSPGNPVVCQGATLAVLVSLLVAFVFARRQ